MEILIVFELGHFENRNYLNESQDCWGCEQHYTGLSEVRSAKCFQEHWETQGKIMPHIE